MVQAIKTGDQAISFFAKHGTNMPIKFLNCNRRPVPVAGYRPYDLVVIEDEKKLDREYYTISAQGVVLVQNEKKRRKVSRPNPANTEFLTLSDWMQQSTMFNVLTSMKFFKYYLISKVFSLWKGNVRYRTFNKTRQNLAASLIQARPDYQPTFLEINKILYEMQVKTTYLVYRQQRSFEIEDFNAEQLNHRVATKTHYNEKIDDIISKRLTNLVNAVSESRTITDAEDLENTKIGQASKNKSMVLQKLEDALKNRVVKLAWMNYNHLGTFIRLIDYMVVETQVRIN
jgi:dynein heavy chain